MRELIADILAVTQRPPLGSVPAFATRAIKEDAGLSALGGRIATYFVQASVQARFGDPQLPVEELRRLASTNDDDIAEAVDELESLGWVSPSRALGAGELGFVRLMPKPRLFARLDAFLMPWNPEEDARTVAAALLNSADGALVTQMLAQELGWTPRRMNPALTVLIEAGAVEYSQSLDQTYESYYLRKNVQTRRFVRERG
jgi:hypothetical protein